VGTILDKLEEDVEAAHLIWEENSKQKPWDELRQNLEDYCVRIHPNEEFELDTSVIMKVVQKAVDGKLGFDYDELSYRAEDLRDPYTELPVPFWFWTSFFSGTRAYEEAKADEVFKRNTEKFTGTYADLLLEACSERRIAYGSRFVAPLFYEGNRLYRLKNIAKTPPHILEFFEVPYSGTTIVRRPKNGFEKQSYSFSMMPAQSVDRAARGRNWNISLADNVPTFIDERNQHSVAYHANDLTLEVSCERVTQLNPRTADVWRLCTAVILESWHEGQEEPPRVWIDARELCDGLGFTKHHGSHKPENVTAAAKALEDLANFRIVIPYGARQYPIDPKTQKRRMRRLEARSIDKVLLIVSQQDVKPLSDNQWITLRWQITAGDWIKAYPRGQFAPLFRSLVELPAKCTPDIWAKSFGTELIWQFRQDKGSEKVQRVEVMLQQAGIWEEARGNANKKRVRDYFEGAMDKLQAFNICTSWEYNSADIDKVETTVKGWFDIWLQTRVIVVPNQEVKKAMEQIRKAEHSHRRKG
jgi:hypothetical protein